MAVKSVVKDEKKGGNARFPRVMSNCMTGNIVLFKSSGVGTVIFLGDNNRKIAKIGDILVNEEMSAYYDYNAPVIIKNLQYD